MAIALVSPVQSVGLDTQASRHLAAIAFCDVVGWSTLIEQDDVAALRAWSVLRSDVIEPLCQRYAGNIVEIAGDAAIVEFSSAVAVATWAVEVQAAVGNRRINDSTSLQVRIGITVDDVLVHGGKLVGDGVNTAARLQQMGDAGDVLATSTLIDLLHNKTSFVFDDLGERTLKNIDRPVRLYRVLSAESRASVRHRPHLSWNSRPGVAVLPFQERASGGESAYFGDGITDEIVTRLAKSRSLYVISRTSTSRYGGQRIETKIVAEELGVRYLLTGSVQRANDQLRIHAELIDAQLDQLIWSERFTGSTHEIFDIQASIAAGIAAAIEPSVDRREGMRASAKPTHSLSAYEHLLRGLSQLYSLRHGELEDAGRSFSQALLLDPQFARAHAYLAWCYNLLIGERISRDPSADRVKALHHASAAVECDPGDAVALAVLGHVSAFLHKRLDAAAQYFDQALAINDSSAFVWGVSASTCCFSGQFEEALQRLQSAKRLSPFDPMNFYFAAVTAIAEFGAQRLEQSIDAAQRALRVHPRFMPARRILCASLALRGDEAAARASSAALLEVDANFRVNEFVSWYPLPEPTLLRLHDGMIGAGLPA